MKKSKIVDDIKIPLELEETDKTRFCFVVFSSKEEHIEIVIDCVERVIKEKENYEVKRLDNSLKSEDNDCFVLVIGTKNDVDKAMNVIIENSFFTRLSNLAY